MTGPALIGATPIYHDRAKTTPTMRNSFGNSVNNGTDSIPLTIPAGTLTGDFVTMVISSKSQTPPTVSPSGGATLRASSQIGDSSSQPFAHVFDRRIVDGDVSSDLGLTLTFSFGAGTTDGICGGGVTIVNTSGYAIEPCSDFEAQTDVLNAHQKGPSALAGMGPNDFYVGVACGLPSTSTGTANVTLSTPPSGCTIASGTNVTALRAGGSAGTCRGQAIFTGPTHAARVETIAYPVGAVFTTCLAWSYAPIPSRWTDQQSLPPSLVGKEVYNYSNSSGSCVVFSQSDVTRGCNTYRPYPERVAKAAGLVNPHLTDGSSPAKVNNMAMGGARACDICTAAYGTFSYTSVRAGANNSAGQTNQYNPQVLTNSALYNRSNIGLYTSDLLGNDFIKLGTDDVTMAGGWNASDACIRLWRSASQIGPTDASHTYSGTWTDVTSDGYMTGAAKKTTVAGSKVTISVTNQDKVDLVLIAYDDTALGVAGSAFTVKVDGVTRTTQQTITLNNGPHVGGGTRSFNVKGTTSNQHQNSGAYKNYKFCQMVISLTGIGSGTHSIEIAPTISSSEFVYNGYLIPSTTPPWVVTNTIWRLPNATYTNPSGMNFASVAIGQETADWFNQMTKQVAAQFADGVIVFDPWEWGTWDSTPTTGDGAVPSGFNGWDAFVHVSTGDGLHQSEMGHAFYADKMIEKINQRIVHPYTPFTSPTSLLPSTVPATITMLGTRDFVVTSGNQTIVIECEGSGGGGGGGSTLGTGRGGGGGAYAKKNSFTYAIGSILRVFVPPGGAGGTSNGSTGTVGTSGQQAKVTYFKGTASVGDFTDGTVLCQADFGTGGGSGAGAVGAGGLVANCIGDVKTAGTSGATSTGGGGAAPLGGGNTTYPGSGQGIAGSQYGGGGTGVNNGSGNAAGAGYQGVVKFS